MNDDFVDYDRDLILSIFDLVDQSKEDPRSLDDKLERFKHAFLVCGYNTGDNRAALENVTWRQDVQNEVPTWGLGLTNNGVLLSTLTAELECIPIPAELSAEIPSLTQREWEACMRVITMLLSSLEARVKEPEDLRGC